MSLLLRSLNYKGFDSLNSAPNVDDSSLYERQVANIEVCRKQMIDIDPNGVEIIVCSTQQGDPDSASKVDPNGTILGC